MTNTIKQKTKYSGVEWFRDTTDIFKIIKIKFLGNLIAGGTPKTEKEEYWGGDIPWLPSGVVQNCIVSNNNAGKYITEKGLKESATKEIPENSPLIALTGATCANVALLKFKATANQSVIALAVNNENDPEFLYYSFLANREQFLIYKTGGAQGGINLDNVKNIYLPIPPLKYQVVISQYLNTKTEQIKKFIDDKIKLISLLQEQKKTVIYNAITTGLDKNIKTKFSGIEWIGDMPENWELRKITRIFESIGSGTTPNTSNREYYNNGDIKWVNTGDLNDGYLEDCEKRITKLAILDNPTLRTYPINSLIIALYGATIGKLSILTFEATVNQACCVMSDTKVADIKFIYYWFLINKENLIQMGYGGGQPNISQDIIRSLKIPLPSLETQKNISKHLDIELKKIDRAIHTVQQEIGLIEEYKKSLIYQAVTGKIETLLTNK
jgi:type I restriction enzyme, S subunit